MFPEDLILYTDDEGCVELHKNVPLQNYEFEMTLISVITGFATTVMVILFVKLIKDLLTNSKVSPFISLTLTPLIVLHVFVIDVRLAFVVKILIQRLF